MYIYEVGAITFHHRQNQIHKATEWRDKLDAFAKDNNIKTFNPAIDFLREKDTYYERLCVDQNDYYINKCDIAIANLNDIDFSPGSLYELVRFKELRKPVIAFCDNGRHWSPHINSCVSQYCETLDDCIGVLVTMFNV